jgi:hypothetical protein
MQNNDILKEAIAEAKTLRQLAQSSAKHSLKKFLLTESLPLNDLCNIDDLDEFIDAILEKYRADNGEVNTKGLPYLNNQYKNREHNTEDEIDERRWFTDDDEFEIDYGDGHVEKSGKDDDDDEKEDEENFSDKVMDERSRKWNNLHGRRNFKSSPAIVSSGVGSTKLSQNERKLLLKHAGLTKNKRTNLIKESKDNLIRQRAGIKNLNKNKARQVVNDLEIKKTLLK